MLRDNQSMQPLPLHSLPVADEASVPLSLTSIFTFCNAWPTKRVSWSGKEGASGEGGCLMCTHLPYWVGSHTLSTHVQWHHREGAGHLDCLGVAPSSPGGGGLGRLAKPGSPTGHTLGFIGALSSGGTPSPKKPTGLQVTLQSSSFCCLASASNLWGTVSPAASPPAVWCC